MQKIKKYIRFNDLVLIIALVIGLGICWSTVSAMQQNYRLQRKYNDLKAQVEVQELRNKNLAYNIKYLKTDDFLELSARDKFNKALPGETMVYLPGNKEEKTAAVARNTVRHPEPRQTGWRGNLNAWWRFVRGKEALAVN